MVAIFHPGELDRRRERLLGDVFLAAKPVARALNDEAGGPEGLEMCGSEPLGFPGWMKRIAKAE